MTREGNIKEKRKSHPLFSPFLSKTNMKKPSPPNK
jgi:hypothetical protein